MRSTLLPQREETVTSSPRCSETSLIPFTCIGRHLPWPDAPALWLSGYSPGPAIAATAANLLLRRQIVGWARSRLWFRRCPPFLRGFPPRPLSRPSAHRPNATDHSRRGATPSANTTKPGDLHENLCSACGHENGADRDR